MIRIQIEASAKGLETVRVRADGGRGRTLDVLTEMMPLIRQMSTDLGQYAQRESERRPPIIATD